MRVPASKAVAFREIAKRRKQPQSPILYGVFATAARAARLSPEVRIARGIVLPSLPERAGYREAEPTLKLMWTQPADEFHKWTALLEAAETSLRAVIVEFIDRYVEAGGELAEMDWPWRTAELRVAS